MSHISFVLFFTYLPWALFLLDFTPTSVFCREFLDNIILGRQDHRNVRVPSSIQLKSLGKELEKQWWKVTDLLLKRGGHQQWYQIKNITIWYIAPLRGHTFSHVPSQRSLRHPIKGCFQVSKNKIQVFISLNILDLYQNEDWVSFPWHKSKLHTFSNYSIAKLISQNTFSNLQNLVCRLQLSLVTPRVPLSGMILSRARGVFVYR